MVVLAVPYGAVDSILSAHKEELAGKVVVDITNPVNFDTFDGLVVPADSSAAAEIQKKVPEALVVKAFNTTFAGVLERWERRNRRWYWQLLTLQMLKRNWPRPWKEADFPLWMQAP